MDVVTALKARIFQRLRFLKAIYAYNRWSREGWIKAEAARLAPGTRVLDVGAGSCPHRPLFRHCAYLTQDVKQLKSEQLEAEAGYGEIDIVSDICAIPLRDASFDVILCSEVIEHVAQPIDALMELARLLRPGGLLLVTAPLRSGLHQEPYHFYGGYTPYWYHRYLGLGHFDRIEISPVGGLFRAYAEEGLRVALYLCPLVPPNLIIKWLLLPFWVIALPCLLLLVPVMSAIDALVPIRAFTVGYRVRATKAQVDEATA